MTDGISPIGAVSGYLPEHNISNKSSTGSTLSFDIEDSAIISAESKMLNELEKYNAGESNEIDLALSTVTNKHQIEAELNVIKTKNEILDKAIKLGEE